MKQLISLFATIFSLLIGQPQTLPSQPDSWTLVSTGDVLTARTINSRSIELNDYLWPWTKTATYLNQADIAFINLETPLIKDCPLSKTGTVFCGVPNHIQGLISAGIDLANLANNHIGNYGQAGIDQTVQTLEEAGITTVGINNPRIVSVRGYKAAFLGYNLIYPEKPGGTWGYIDTVGAQVASASAQADFTIVAFHWGVEYTPAPTKEQIQLAHLAIDQGADAVIGHHPHWIQTTEFYGGKPIIYSHGNFIFDQFWSPETQKGIISKITFSQTDDPKMEIIPIAINPQGAPYFMQNTPPTEVTSGNIVDPE